MTTPEPLKLTDRSGDALYAFPTGDGERFTVTVLEDDRPATVLLGRDQVRVLSRSLAAWLGEHALGYVRCDRCDVLFDPVTGHHCPPTHDGLYDDEQVRRWLGDEAQPCPTCSGPIRHTVGMVCPTCGTDYAPEATVTHVEHQQLPPAVSKTAPDAERP